MGKWANEFGLSEFLKWASDFDGSKSGHSSAFPSVLQPARKVLLPGVISHLNLVLNKQHLQNCYGI